MFRIHSAARTHVGLVRRNNEDAFADRGEDGLWAVADGMGGHEHGERASAEVAWALNALYVPTDFDAACQVTASAIHQANRRVFEEATDRGVQMGSTAVALFLRDGRFAIFWVGDSRAYLLRDGALHQLTRDHTQVQEMVDRGLITADEAATHPMAHILARAVGVEAVVEVDVIADTVQGGDVFLLCSDGLSGPVPEAEIVAALGLHDADAAADRLVAAALTHGAPDNVTVVVVALDEATMLSLSPLPGVTA